MHCLSVFYTVFAALCFLRSSFSGETTGEQVYSDQCARCHGKAGEGTNDNYPDPLVGDKSVAQLTGYIHESMPDNADEKCSSEDAAKVAAYIYDAFYSADARTRNKPARVELSRLTVRQHENAIADIIGSFRPAAEWGTERGLRAEYFNSREPKDDARKFELIGIGARRSRVFG
jgi:cytochrome c553